MSLYEYNHRGGVFMELIQILKALGEESRIRILNILIDGELCVGEIEYILGMSQSNASRHLNKLFYLQIIKCEKKSQWVFYKLNEDKINEFPFIKELIDDEFHKLKICCQDIKKLQCYKQSGMTCEDLKTCK